MFQFLKKSGQKYRPRFIQNCPENRYESQQDCNALFHEIKVPGVSSSNSPCILEEEEEDETCNDLKTSACSFRSQLSKTLPQILADKGALGYFIQFMDTRSSIALIKFWLEVECLCGAFPSRESNSKNNDESHRNVSNPLDDNDNFSSNVVIENDNDGNDKLSLNNDTVIDADQESNCYVIPKISQTFNGARRSNYVSGQKQDASTTRQDALRIYKKYIAKDLLGANRVPENLKSQLEQALESGDIVTVLSCLSSVQKIVYEVLENEHIHDFLRSEFYCKHQIDVLTSGNVQLADILYNETTFFYFMEFMELENKRELLDFWMTAINYKQNLLEKGDTTNPMEAQTDALIIYDKYFSLQATMPIGFSDKVRLRVEENICRENGEGPLPDCFDKPCKIVYNFLNKHYLPTFLSSQLYYKYLSELITTIQSSSCSSGVQPRLRRAGSDCSSEVSSVSVSTQNISQAAGHDTSDSSAANNNKKKTNVNGSMNIDTRQLYDPDSLWKRHKYSLSVGYIDNLGRFVTEIEPDPHRKYESRLSRAVKRLVNMEQDKAKEELAWKIAEMIIREITSLTLGTSNLPS